MFEYSDLNAPQLFDSYISMMFVVILLYNVAIVNVKCNILSYIGS